jgi:hypothetical protein
LKVAGKVTHLGVSFAALAKMSSVREEYFYELAAPMRRSILG